MKRGMAKENPISNLASEPLLGNREIGQNSGPQRLKNHHKQ